jgi:hypothetical protein
MRPIKLHRMTPTMRPNGLVIDNETSQVSAQQ